MRSCKVCVPNRGPIWKSGVLAGSEDIFERRPAAVSRCRARVRPVVGIPTMGLRRRAHYNPVRLMTVSDSLYKDRARAG